MSNEELLQEMVDIIASCIHLKLVSNNTSMKAVEHQRLFDDNMIPYGRWGFYAWVEGEDGEDYGYAMDCPLEKFVDGDPGSLLEFAKKSDIYLKDCLSGRRPVKHKTQEELKDAIANLER